MNCGYHLSLFWIQRSFTQLGKKNHSRIQPTYFLMMHGQPIYTDEWCDPTHSPWRFPPCWSWQQNHSTKTKQTNGKAKKSSEPSNLHDFVLPCQSSGGLNNLNLNLRNLDLEGPLSTWNHGTSAYLLKIVYLSLDDIQNHMPFLHKNMWFKV